MGILDFFKITKDDTKSLKKEDFNVVGEAYYEENIKKLAVRNPDWKSTHKTLEKKGLIGKKIFRYDFINKPVKLVPEPKNKHDKNAVQIIIAGELVGYVPAPMARHVKDILKNHEIKYVTAYINGGDYKVVSSNGDMYKDSYNISITIRIAYV